MVLWSAALIVSVCHRGWGNELPLQFDLRDSGMVSEVRYQSGGTCWTHGTMAAIESHLLITGVWGSSARTGLPNLAEYHLDWWNGFNAQSNSDWAGGGGLTVHLGGDYLVTAAYLSRGDGAVYSEAANDDTERDTPWYQNPPARHDPGYAYYYVRDIEWHTAGWNLERIDLIKHRIMTEGAMATCMAYDSQFISSYIHYQPRTSIMLPNHSIAIVGWDDEKVTPAPDGPGAWLCKNSWGSYWGQDGYFWISYYDRWCCQEPNMGAVFFRNVEPMPYDHVYYHDLHGWRETMVDCREAFNAFRGQGHQMVDAVSFYTAADEVDYTVVVYETFQDGNLSGELARATGTQMYKGFHTVDLNQRVEIFSGEDFFVYVSLSEGGHAYDQTSEVPVLLDGPDEIWQSAGGFEEEFLGKSGLGDEDSVLVVSTAYPGESFYWDGELWVDMQDVNGTANFCIKALAVTQATVEGDFNGDWRVDEKDVAVLAGAWLMQEGQEGYRRICDIHDATLGVIDIADFAAFSRIWASLYQIPR